MQGRSASVPRSGYTPQPGVAVGHRCAAAVDGAPRVIVSSPATRWRRFTREPRRHVVDAVICQAPAG